MGRSTLSAARLNLMHIRSHTVASSSFDVRTKRIAVVSSMDSNRSALLANLAQFSIDRRRNVDLTTSVFSVELEICGSDRHRTVHWWRNRSVDSAIVWDRRSIAENSYQPVFDTPWSWQDRARVQMDESPLLIVDCSRCFTAWSSNASAWRRRINPLASYKTTDRWVSE